MRQINPDLIDRLMDRERRHFLQAHPRSAERFAQAQGSLLGGVPMNWMVRWPGPFPLFVEAAGGARFTDIDGHEYVDFCLGEPLGRTRMRLEEVPALTVHQPGYQIRVDLAHLAAPPVPAGPCGPPRLGPGPGPRKPEPKPR